MRLQKYMADAGIASRRKCEELISLGRVTINGEKAALGCSVDPERDEIALDGKRVEIAPERVVYAFYKPQGVICSASDPKGRETVQDYFRSLPYRLYNVGRLDYDSEGLLLMTNDGELAYALTHPSCGIEKTYYVVCDGKLYDDQKRALEEGVALEDGMTASARITDVYRTGNGNTSFAITIHEGRNRQIRRMLEAVGHKTLLLRRVQEGPVKLGSMKPGDVRKLNESELGELRKACAIG
ncbi:MAG TPA: pseudouridine synthase [Clostridia bacterium]|nr:pseudouridine synthase [Clostridia bacterium]